MVEGALSADEVAALTTAVDDIYWWLRTKDDMTIRPELLAACAPIRRQLLAPTPTVSSPDEDVHLKVWLKEQGSASARQPGPVTSSGQQHKSPISSRKIVPLWASSNRPRFWDTGRRCQRRHSTRGSPSIEGAEDGREVAPFQVAQQPVSDRSRPGKEAGVSCRGGRPSYAPEISGHPPAPLRPG